MSADKEEPAVKQLDFGRLDSASSGSGCEEADAADADVFAPVEEVVSTFDYANIQSVGAKTAQEDSSKKRARSKLSSLKRHLKNFVHEERPNDSVDEHGNVELPMSPYEQASDEHDSGLVPTRRLFRLALIEQQQLEMRNSSRKEHDLEKHEIVKSRDEKDHNFLWLVKTAVKQDMIDFEEEQEARLKGKDEADDGANGDSLPDVEQQLSTTSDMTTARLTQASRVGTGTVEFRNRTVDGADGNRRLSEVSNGSLDLKEKRLRERQQQLLNLFGLTEAPTAERVTEDEREQACTIGAGKDVLDSPSFPCDCCSQRGVESPAKPDAFYDLLFVNRKNASFSARFDMVHCLPRFVLRYKFFKQLPDCLSQTERLDLVKAAADMCVGYGLRHCTLQIPFGKYRTNAYGAFFAYLLTPHSAKYLEVFEVANPAHKPGIPKEKQAKCLLPNWPDKSYITKYWSYSHREDAAPVDEDPTLNPTLYQRNVLHKKVTCVLPELQVTRENPPEKVRKRPKQDLGFYGTKFALVLHHTKPLLGFGTVRPPGKQPDVNFILELFNTMLEYVRDRINTPRRKLAGKEDLSCCINVSMEHSYDFRGNQGVYGFITFPETSTYWKMLYNMRQMSLAAVTHSDILSSLASQSAAGTPTTSADRTKLDESGSLVTQDEPHNAEEEANEERKFCRFM